MESSPKATKPEHSALSEQTQTALRQQSEDPSKGNENITLPYKVRVQQSPDTTIQPSLKLDCQQPSRAEELAPHFQAIIETLIPNWRTRFGLHDTPLRAAKALVELTTPEAFDFTIFEEEHSDQLIVQNGILVHSLCEHHLLPFFGTVSIGYLPNNRRVVGLSKLARLVRFYASGLSTQERITAQIAEFLYSSKLVPIGVGVSMRCYHTCMSLRGVKDSSAVTTTEYLAGEFRRNLSVRSEFTSKVSHPAVYQ